MERSSFYVLNTVSSCPCLVPKKISVKGCCYFNKINRSEPLGTHLLCNCKTSCGQIPCKSQINQINQSRICLICGNEICTCVNNQRVICLVCGNEICTCTTFLNHHPDPVEYQ